MKDYQVFRCPSCGCEYTDRTAPKGKSVGDPMFACPECQQKSFRKSVLEPAVISQNTYFNVRFSSFYGNFRIVIILIYAVFLFFVLIKRDMLLSLFLVVAAVVIFAVYILVRAVHRYCFFKSDEYDNEIAASMARLGDASYARLIADNQGIDKNSVYYFVMTNGKDMKK